LLALRLGREVSREWLADCLWPESDPRQALYNLRRCLADLRRAFGTDTELLQTPTRLTLCLQSDGVRVDAVAFAQGVEGVEAGSLEQAIELYRAPLLEGCSMEWAAREREGYQSRYLAALKALAAQAAASREVFAEVRYLRLMVGADPLQEENQRALMAALAGSGDYAAVTQVYRDLRLLLQREINAEPSPDTDALYRRLMEQAKQPSSLAALPVTPPARLSRRLPVPLTSLIGRERNMEEVSGWIRQGRLVTLVGAGGVGKTRLALAVGEKNAHAYPDGVWFVGLATLSDPELLEDTLATALGIPKRVGASPLELLCDHLASRSLLLILDNCEHLLDACAQLASRLLSACSELKLLATSRKALGILGERAYRVPSLPLPPVAAVDESKDITALLEYAGVRLFVERALLTRSNFRLTRQNAKDVCRVCRHLDGIPLAIELAAARMRSLTVEEIRAHLKDRFALLTAGDRTAPPRHQTLRALIDWSYDQLSAPEQALLRHVSVFAGTWTLEAADYVCRDEGEWEPVSQGKDGDGTASSLAVEAPDSWTRMSNGGDTSHPFFLLSASSSVLDLLTSLVDQSLVMHTEHGGGSRYTLLETIRQYAAERLHLSPLEPRVRARHRDFYLALAERIAPVLTGVNQVGMLDQLEVEHENLRAALEWCRLEPSGAIHQLRLATALGKFWLLRGYFHEGLRQLQAALARPQAHEPSLTRAQALYAAAYLAGRQGETETAWALHQQSLDLYRELAHPEGMANALIGLGLAACAQGDYKTARPLLEQSLDIQRQIGNEAGVAIALNNLGLIAWYQGDNSTAKEWHEGSLAIKRRLGNRMGIAFSLNNLGLVALAVGDFGEAKSLLEQSLALRRELSDRFGIADTLNYLGVAAWCERDYERAKACHEQSLELQRDLGNPGGIANSLCNLALVLTVEGEYSTALVMMQESLETFRDLDDRMAIARVLEALSFLASKLSNLERSGRLWGAAEALRARIEAPLLPSMREAFVRLAPALGEGPEANPAFLAAREEGWNRPIEQAISYALEDRRS
jgi:predicted ATPase/DNA-binding SARP family transcriptional activator